MRTFVLSFIWFVVEFILWIVVILLVVTKDEYESIEVTKRNEKYLKILKSIFYVIAILFSMAIGYFLND